MFRQPKGTLHVVFRWSPSSPSPRSWTIPTAPASCNDDAALSTPGWAFETVRALLCSRTRGLKASKHAIKLLYTTVLMFLSVATDTAYRIVERSFNYC